MIEASSTLIEIQFWTVILYSCVHCIHLRQEPFLSLSLASLALQCTIVVENSFPFVIIGLKVWLNRFIASAKG